MKEINLFEIKELKNDYWYLYYNNYNHKVLTDRQELIDLAMNILYFTRATNTEKQEVIDRIKENLKEVKL